jgi:hypothetical protein
MMCICFDFLGAIGLWLHCSINMFPFALYTFFALNLAKCFVGLLDIMWLLGLFMIGVPKKRKKDSKTFVGLHFINNVHLK